MNPTCFPSAPRWALPLLLLLLIAACTPQTGASGSPSSSSEATASEVASVSASPSAPSSTPPFSAVGLPPESLVVLSVGAAFHRTPSDPVLLIIEPGSEVIIHGGPRQISGETWYEVRYPAQEPNQVGWVRLQDPGAATVVEGDCPDDPQAAMGMLAWDRLQCYAGASLTLTGEVGHCQGGVVYAEPAWLAYACWGIGDGLGGGMDLHAAPDSGVVFPDHRVRARVTGHFDDPASATCRSTEAVDEAWMVPSASEQVLLCREAFVVDAFEILEDLGPQEG